MERRTLFASFFSEVSQHLQLFRAEKKQSFKITSNARTEFANAGRSRVFEMRSVLVSPVLMAELRTLCAVDMWLIGLGRAAYFMLIVKFAICRRPVECTSSSGFAVLAE